MNEIWKDIKGYEGFYKISNLGNIKSMRQGKILKPQDNSRGYLRIHLKSDNTEKVFFVHRLVAEHFIEKKEGNNIVNHLDCNPHNNNAENLEWTTFKGNSQYMQKLGRNKRTTEWIKRLTETQRRVNGKKVQGIALKGTQVLNYEGVNDTRKDGFQPSCVSCCCNGKRLTHKGFVWRFV